MRRNVIAKNAVLNAVAGIFSVSALLSAPQVLAGGASTQALEAQIQLLEEQLQSIRGELDRVKSDTVRNEQKIRENEQSVASVKAAEQKAEKSDKHIIFFRGGFAHSNHLRNGVSIQSNVVPLRAQDRADRDAWYIGAGFDFNLTDDVWGFLPGTSVFAELMFEYKEFGNRVQGNALATNPTPIAVPGGTARNVTVSQFTLTAAPKIKFLEGSRFRPWIIPAGLALHVISPPSESITVLQPGVMFGAGADYNLWKSIYVGVDARYQLAGGKIDGVNVSGFTAGGYLGIGF